MTQLNDLLESPETSVPQRTVKLSVPIRPILFGLVLLALVGAYTFNATRPAPANTAKAISKALPIHQVSALGRLEPQGEVISISASPIGGNRVAQLLVQEGQSVDKNQILALLDQHDRLLSALQRAQGLVGSAQARLRQVQAGAKTGDIVAQQRITTRLHSELEFARSEYERYQALYAEGAISASLLDSKQLAVQSAEQQLEQANASLSSVKEVRSEDVALARADVTNAILAVQQAKADLELSYIRAPQKGRVLKIISRTGEAIGTTNNASLLQLGQTDQMYVVAEVYESDVNQISVGGKATITSTAFKGSLHGQVTRIGWQIGKQDVLKADPAADVDARVVEVRIRLDPKDSLRVAHLTNMQVEVSFALTGGK
jgi:HlyD family secretion protein